MPELTFDAYEQVVRNSGLVLKPELDPIVAKVRGEAGGRPVNSNLLSRALLQAKLITPWQQDKLEKGFFEGFFLGKYKLLDHLGRGGMSTVYLAEHTLMRRRVAIKVLHHFLTKKSSYLERFYLEARAGSTLNHHNVVRADSVGCEGGFHYLVMEYVEGLTLQQMVDAQGPLPVDASVDYIRQAAIGLHHAHRHGLIHRDIKPANLIVNPKGVLKVFDLGLARLSTEEARSLTLKYNERRLSTVDYLAPEQARHSHHIDLRADIYSLGCTLYCLLIGTPPFDGTATMRLIKHKSEMPPTMHSRRPEVPDSLDVIVNRMMAKAPEDRYQSMAEVSEILEQWLFQRQAQGTTSAPKADPAAAAASGPQTRRLRQSQSMAPSRCIWEPTRTTNSGTRSIWTASTWTTPRRLTWRWAN